MSKPYELRIPVITTVDDQKLFNRGFSFNFVSLVWAVFGGILRYLLKLKITFKTRFTFSKVKRFIFSKVKLL